MKMVSLATMSLTLAITLFSGSEVSARELSYADFLKSCQDPTAYGHQRPPENIRVTCTNVQQGWEPIEAGSTTLDESRLLSTELFSDKHHIKRECFNLVVPEFNVLCPRFREVKETVTIDKTLTCALLLDDDRSLQEICTDAINEAVAANPDLVDVVPTGAVFNTCEGTGQKP
jgi:hypothetical protein